MLVSASAESSDLRYSLVVPIYFDSELATDFCLEVAKIFEKYCNTDSLETMLELIFVSDGSGPRHEENLLKLKGQFPFVKVVILSRNFGQHLAISAGYKVSRGKWVAMLNVDQQDPISELPKFFDFAQNHAVDKVYGLRSTREDSILNRFTSVLFNIVLNKLTNNDSPINTSTMRVMSRRFINVYNSLSESQRYLPGLENWIGFESGYVDTIHRERTDGVSSYTFKKRLNLAINSILSFSDYPLRLIVKFGFTVSFLGMLFIFGLIVAKLSGYDFQAGYPSLIAVIVMTAGLLTTVVGVASLYIGRILAEVQKRPNFIIKEFHQ